MRRFLVTVSILLGASLASAGVSDTDESAYSPAPLSKALGGVARAQNDEAELAAPGLWYFTTATYTGHARPISGRYRPILGAWVSSRGLPLETVELYFSGELQELEFEQGGRKYWVLAGLPGGLGFEVYPAGQQLTIYLQRVGFASGIPVAVLTLAKLPGGAAAVSAPAGRTLRNARLGAGARRQEAVFRNGYATLSYGGREYTLPLDVAGRHSIPPGIYSYANGVRAALLEFGAGDDRYLLLRVPAGEGAAPAQVLPYLVLNGHITPPIDTTACSVDAGPVARTGVRGSVDCSSAPQVALTKLKFSAE